MIENGLFLTDSDAELLSRALAEVKTKVYEESETSLDDSQALDALLSGIAQFARVIRTEYDFIILERRAIAVIAYHLLEKKIVGNSNDARVHFPTEFV
jgi:hypothetical protein